MDKEIVLGKGCHASRIDGVCAMEAAAYLAGEPHSDRPECVSDVIGAFMRKWNDDLPDDETRTRLLLPLIPKIIGTSDGGDVELSRVLMPLDWLVRVNVPTWLDVAGLTEPANSLRTTPQVDAKTIKPSISAVRAVRESSFTKTSSDAITLAATTGAWAAYIAADEMAWDVWAGAAWAAGEATVAARGDVEATVATLQASAQDLVRRMAALRA